MTGMYPKELLRKRANQGEISTVKGYRAYSSALHENVPDSSYGGPIKIKVCFISVTG